jgi:hypothetical protein
MKFAETRCPRCALLGEKTLYIAGYWPLSDGLLTHLDRLKPERVKDAIRERLKRNYETERSAKRTYDNNFESHLADWQPHIMGIPQVGLNKTAYWVGKE